MLWPINFKEKNDTFLPALSSESLVRHHIAVVAPTTFPRVDSVIFRKRRIQTFTPSSPFTCYDSLRLRDKALCNILALNYSRNDQCDHSVETIFFKFQSIHVNLNPCSDAFPTVICCKTGLNVGG